MSAAACIIPARGGSVRIPRKNIKEFRGKPMIQWPIDAAKESGRFGLIVVSTDDDEIAALAEQLGCAVSRRPKDDGTMGTQEIAAMTLESMGPFYGDAVVIYPCSPMLTSSDIHGILDRLSFNKYKPPFCSYVVTTFGSGADAGCMYAGKAYTFEQGIPLKGNVDPYVVSRERFIDINTPEDWARAESMYDALRRA